MKIQKPELTPATRMRANELYRLLKEKVCTKEELQIRFFKFCSSSHDRQIRDLISIVAKKFSVIATSDSKGYWIASKQEDLNEVHHELKELDSRIEELNKRRQPLIGFCEIYEGGKNNV